MERKTDMKVLLFDNHEKLYVPEIRYEQNAIADLEGIEKNRPGFLKLYCMRIGYIPKEASDWAIVSTDYGNEELFIVIDGHICSTYWKNDRMEINPFNEDITH